VSGRLDLKTERRDGAGVADTTLPTPGTSRTLAERLRERGTRLLDYVLAGRDVRLLELVGVTVIVSVVTLVLFTEHAIDAGFYSDDWAYRTAWWTFEERGGFGEAFEWFWETPLLSGRPALAVYLALVQAAFGEHQGWYLGWAMILAALLSVSFYLFLRTLRMPPLHAAVIALLVLVFPASDSTRIWAIISDAQVSMSACLLGGVLALRSFDRSGRRRALLRGGSLALFGLSILLYELTMVAIAASAVVYRCRVPWRRALRAGALDVGLVLVLYVLFKRTAETERLGLSAALDHGREIADQVVELFTSVVIPLETTELVVLLAVGVVIVAAIAVGQVLPAGDWARTGLRRWLVTLAVAGTMVLAAYVVYAPASLFYMPLAPGLLNRTNAFGALPLVVIVYALGALAGILASRGLGRGPRLAGVLALVPAGLVGLSYTDTLTRDLALWDSAYARAQRTLTVIGAGVPKPSSHTLLIAYGQPVEEAPGIPVWAHHWDLDGAIRLMWRDTTLAGRPAFPGTEIRCGRATVRPHNPAAGTVYLPQDRVPYGKLILVDTNTGRFAMPRSRRECLEQAPTFVPGPFHTPVDQLP
jgi:hypothetical protein